MKKLFKRPIKIRREDLRKCDPKPLTAIKTIEWPSSESSDQFRLDFMD